MNINHCRALVRRNENLKGKTLTIGNTLWTVENIVITPSDHDMKEFEHLWSMGQKQEDSIKNWLEMTDLKVRLFVFSKNENPMYQFIDYEFPPI